MNVRDLIAELMEMPLDARVVVDDDGLDKECTGAEVLASGDVLID